MCTKNISDILKYLVTMNLKSKKFYHLVDEFPWPFLVSTASLFLTFGAVSCLDFSSDVEYCMLNWSGFASQVANTVRKTILTQYGGTLVNRYGTKPNTFIYGNVVYTPENYNQASIHMLKDLADAYTKEDNDRVYAIWRIVMCNPDGMFSQNYGKLCNTINNMTNDYNRGAVNEFRVTEIAYFDKCKIPVNEHSFSKDSKDQFNSMVETSKMEIATRKSQGSIEYQRNLYEHQIQGIANLGLQANNDCIVVLKYDKNVGGIHIGYVDCKKLDEISLRQKIDALQQQGHILQPLQGTRAIFGCNLYLVAKEGEELMLDPKEKAVVTSFIASMAEQNPNFFKDYQNSPEFTKFRQTGNLAELSSSVYPFPKIITSADFRKYLKFKPVVEKDTYDKYLVNCNTDKNSSFIIDIIENDS
ncbi:hypothetical protein EON71_00590 [bacterium]|nr:MAG: hypothetical protein EON71_00590 [bacterium]